MSMKASDCTTRANLSPSEPATPPLSYHPASVIHFAKLDALPPASRLRELTKAANKFLGNACHLFIHHVDPLLGRRRQELLESGKTRKKFYKDARQLWALGDRFFWEQQVAQLRLNLKQGHLSAEQILRNAGAKDEWLGYLHQAERDVAAYLGTEVPEWVEETLLVGSGEEEAELYETPPAESIQAASPRLESLESLVSDPLFQLLDTLADEFPVEAKQVYGNFAQLWPYDDVRKAEGRHQDAMLRQLADLLDHGGKELFYYYAYPRLCKIIQPCPTNWDIASIAQAIWKFMKGTEKSTWERASAVTKKLLGDGNLEGLDRIQLDGKHEEVLRLHEMTESAVKDWKERCKMDSETSAEGTGT